MYPSVAGTDPRTGETMLASVGISLFDYFAGQALIGRADNLDTYEERAKSSYKQARAMLAERALLAARQAANR